MNLIKYRYIICLIFIVSLFVFLIYNCGGAGSSTGKADPTSDPNYKPLPERVQIPEAEKSEFFKNMVEIKGGTFKMGTNLSKDCNCDKDENPQHEVKLESFWIDKYETRISEFKKFVEETGYKTTAEKKGKGKIYRDNLWVDVPKANWKKPRKSIKLKDYPNQPVSQVSWYDAKEFCSWAKKRLPTEAEWEYMAGGPEHTIYPTGNEFNEESVIWNVQESPDDNTKPVGSKKETGYGMFDVAGNVWEWVSTLYDDFPYPYKVDDGRENYNNIEGMRRTFRGGSAWNNEHRIFRVANRASKGDPDYAALNVGFRCVY